MKRLSVFTAAALLLAFAAALTVTPPASQGQGQKGGIKRKARAVPGQYIVTLQTWAAQPFGENSFVPNVDRKSTRLNSSHDALSRMPSSA